MVTSSPSYIFLLVFFVYGLAFFSMGFAIALEARRSPILADARVLVPLALFGILHGFHEWVEMFIQIGRWFNLEISPWTIWARQALLVLSFSSLILFGLLALQWQGKRLPVKSGYLLVGWLLVYSLLVIASVVAQPEAAIQVAEHADVLARYLLAMPGAFLAAVALWGQSRQLKDTGRAHLTPGLDLAAWSFFFYGLTQLVVPPADWFPASYINTATFIAWTGVPIQLLRAVLAVAASVGVLHSIQASQEERHRELFAAQQDRLDALERVQHELQVREVMRRELLRHTVIAQEEERSRIARELHDETSQLLTALTLDLATLRNSLTSSRQSAEIIDRLQSLNRQISQGIYRLVGDLRPAQLDDLGLAAALRYQADLARQRDGLDVMVNMFGSQQRLDLLVETVLFRIAQEALTNISRHAACHQAWLDLKFKPGEVTLTIRDDGIGFDSQEELRPPRGWGIAGMQERAESVGGSFRVQSVPGGGTLVEAIVPVLEGKSTRQEVDQYELNPVDVG